MISSLESFWSSTIPGHLGLQYINLEARVLLEESALADTKFKGGNLLE